jgi:hypothetical protein
MARKREEDPVYLVILALGIGLGTSGGAAGGSALNGFIIGATTALAGCLVYYLIKRSKQPKKRQGPKSKYKM